MKIELDVHTHTIASGHAFSTLQEMAQAAADKGLKVLGITEHSPGVPGTCHPIYFRNLHVVPRRMNGVELLLGAEINILDLAADTMAAQLRSGLGDRVLGPDKPPVARIQTLFIKKMIVKVEQNASIKKVRDYLLAVQRAILEDERFRSLLVYYDVDPQ